MKLKLLITCTFDTDAFIDPSKAAQYFETCEELQKINTDYVEDVKVTVIGEINDDSH